MFDENLIICQLQNARLNAHNYYFVLNFEGLSHSETHGLFLTIIIQQIGEDQILNRDAKGLGIRILVERGVHRGADAVARAARRLLQVQ